MNYEKIIVELLGRIQTLEEQVAVLMENQENLPKRQANKISTDDICQYIEKQKEAARTVGKSTLVLKSGEIHKDMDLSRALPQVCNAMRRCMNDSDVVLFTTTSGYSSTITIEYKL